MADELAQRKDRLHVRLDESLKQAQERRERELATQDAAVKRAWESGHPVEDIARNTGYSQHFVTGSLKRQNLEPHPRMRLTGRRKSFRNILRKVRRG